MAIIGANNGGNPSSNLSSSIYYNGCTFHSPRFRSRLQQVPEESVDGRTILCNTYRLSVRGIVTDDESGYRAFINSTNTNSLANRRLDQYNARSNIQKIRSLLSHKGGRLTIRGMGLDIDINDGTPDSLFDVRFGPTTKSLVLEQIGNGVVWQIFWECEFSIPECSTETPTGHAGHTAGGVNVADVSWIGFPYTSQGMVEGLVWDVGYTIDSAGLTQRVITGEYSVAISRASSVGGGEANTVVTTADALREIIEPEIPPNFRRSQSNWRLSMDRRKMAFVVVDTELPGENGYPPGIVDLAVDYTVSVDGVVLPVAPIVNCTFSGYCEVGKGYALGDAFDKIILIMQTRLDKARDAIVNAAAPALPVGSNPIYITGTTVTESMFGARRITFALSYIIMNLKGNALFTGIVERTALFQPNTNAGGNQLFNWNDWSGGFQSQGHWSQRGIAGLTFDVRDDQIVGPCEGEDSNPDPGDDYYLPTTVTEGGGSLVTDCPPEGYDYLLWDADISVETENGTTIHKPMGTPTPSSGLYNAGIVQELKSVDPDPANTENVPLSLAYRPPNTGFENTGSFASAGSTLKISVSVLSIRVGRPPEIPSVNLAKFHALYDQGKLIPKDSQTDISRLGKLGKCSLYCGMTNVEYTLTSLADPTAIQTAIGSIREALTYTAADLEGSKLGGDDDRA